MARIDARILGYRRIRVKKEDVGRLAGILLRLGISADVCAAGEVDIRESEVKKFKAYADGRIRYELSEPLGLRGALYSLRHRYGLMVGVLVSLLAVYLLSGVIWDVRVSGAENTSEQVIIQALEEQGVGIGRKWSRIDKNRAEVGALTDCEQISWISINRRGTVAYVTVIEKLDGGDLPPLDDRPCNVVADRDGVIEQISVQSGCAVVSVGDVVRKGDVLISGIMETENGTRLCHASGVVIAQSSATVSAEVARAEVEKVYFEAVLGELDLRIFNFSINIFKNYGNLDNDYDIIYDVREYALLRQYKLPISFLRSYYLEYVEETVIRTDAEMAALAGERLTEMIRLTFASCDVIKLRTTGALSDEAYVMTSYVIYSADIGVESVIEIY